MKCIQCQTDNNLKDRTANQGRCKNCNHPFVFEPTTMGQVKITDPFFARAIADLSVNQTLSFMPKQFLYFLDRRLKKKNSFSPVGLAFVALFWIVWSTGFIGGFLSALIGSVAFPFVLLANLILLAIFSIRRSQDSTLLVKDRLKSLNCLQVLGLTILILGILRAISLNSPWLYVGGALLGLAAVWGGLLLKRRAANIPESLLITAPQVEDWLTSWQRVNGTISALTFPSSPTPSPSNLEAEITAYSFDRAVICQTASIAQLLVANNFHFEHNCAILSIDGYPRNIFGTVREMLQRNPNLQVYAFHDLSPHGLHLIPQLQNSNDWFANHPVPIIDVGLTPAQFFSASRNFYVRRNEAYGERARQLEPEIIASLTPEQKAWLAAGNYIELESFTPKMLIQILQRWIGRGQQLTDADSGFIVLSEGGNAYLYATESFG